MTTRIPSERIEEWKRQRPVPTRVPGGDPIVNGWIAAWDQDRRFAAVLLSEREEMLSLLRGVERAGPCGSCPACGSRDPASRHVGHAPDCRLAAFLKET